MIESRQVWQTGRREKFVSPTPHRRQGAGKKVVSRASETNRSGVSVIRRVLLCTSPRGDCCGEGWLLRSTARPTALLLKTQPHPAVQELAGSICLRRARMQSDFNPTAPRCPIVRPHSPPVKISVRSQCPTFTLLCVPLRPSRSISLSASIGFYRRPEKAKISDTKRALSVASVRLKKVPC